MIKQITHDQSQDCMRPRIIIRTPDPVLQTLLSLQAAQLPEPFETVVLLDAAWMERISEFPGRKIILFTVSADPGYLAAARKSGAVGFRYLEPAEADLTRILSGKPAFPAEAPTVRFGNARSNAVTLRELDVLREIVAGKTDAEIAEKLSLSVPTIKHHIQQLFFKTGFSNRTQIAVAAVSCGLISIKR